VAAALAIGMTPAAFRGAIDGYRMKVGKPDAIVSAIPERLDQIEACLVRMEVAEMARDLALAALDQSIRELNARQPVLLVERYATHKRQTDGGVGGKVERGGRR